MTDQVQDPATESEQLFRRATALIGTDPVDEEQVLSLLREVYALGDRWGRYLAKITQVHLKLSPPNGPWPHPQEKVELLTRTARHTLDAITEDFRTAPPHRLNFEVEWRLLFARLSIAEIIRDKEQMDALAAQIVSLAEMKGNPELLREALARQAEILMKIGNYSESMRLILGDSKSVTVESRVYYEEWNVYNLTHNLMNLGAPDGAVQFIEEALNQMKDDPRLLGRLYWFRLISGKPHDLQPPEHAAWANQRVQNEVLYHLTCAERDYPFKTRTLQAQQASLFQALNLVKAPHENQAEAETDVLFVRWLRGRTRLQAREYGLALQELARLPAIEREELLNRTLLAGLHLELGMSPSPIPGPTLSSAAAEIRSVFAAARALPYAEPASLARILLRWHPHAAAFCALMPDPVPELESSLQNVLKTGSRTTWRAKAIPAGIPEYLTRRALRLPAHLPKLGGNALSQVSRLRDQFHNLNIQGPFISPLALAVGLSRSGFAEAAHVVMKDFGVSDQIGSDPLLVQLAEALQNGSEDLEALLRLE